MQNGESKIESLFNADRIFKIPTYQRSYTWQEENYEDFLNDILNQRGEKPYFLGTFLFHKKKNRVDFEVIDIVDGQQRLTTIMIFMKILIEKLEALNSKKISKKTYRRYIKDSDGVYKLELENEDQSFLHQCIFDDSNKQSFDTPAQKNLYNSKNYFKKNLEKLSIEKLEHIFSVLTEANIINYVVNDISDATQIFELLNDRGRNLTNLESIKSFLMYKISSLDLKDYSQPINSIQNNMASIYRIIEAHNIDENDVLRYHTIAFEKSKLEDYNKPSMFIKTEINNMFIGGIDNMKIKERAVNYIISLKESFEIFRDILTNKPESKLVEHFYMIGRVGPFYPFVMIIYRDQRERLDEFLEILNHFNFKAAFIKLQNHNEKFYRFIREGANLFDVFKLPIINDWWNINNRVDDTLQYMNYYHWIPLNIVRYILFQYESELREKEGYQALTLKNYFEKEERKKLSIEHIAAQKSNLNFSDSFNEKYMHSIGNLVIDTKSSNSRKGKKGVEVKSLEYKKAPIMSQNEINNNSKINWNKVADIKEFIDKRDEKIKAFINENFLIPPYNVN